MKNAFTGYTYQEKVTFLFLAKMDAERRIDKTEIEVDENHKFDDLIISSESEKYKLQIKDIKGISINKLSFTKESVKINGKEHKLSEKTNVIFFKNIDIKPNSKILDFPAQKKDNVYLISLSRLDIENIIEEIYKSNPFRIQVIHKFFSKCLDNRIWTIKKKDLPTINVFNTQLIEPTIKLSREILTNENLLVIEGKPGIGKSHFVNSLKDIFTNNLVYRFWISSQDKDKNERLKYEKFISDFSKKIFNDLLHRDENVIIQEISKEQKTVIIDGLDHVENYNHADFKKYINFIDRLKENCKTIVLTRPLKVKLNWEKQQLTNWNKKQTEDVLNQLYHISDYKIVSDIFSITNGYPILVKYVAEHYKKHSSIPKLDKLDTVDSYYEQIIKNEKGKHSLSLFLCSRTYYMKSEIYLFLNDEAEYINEFIKEHSYLFEIRLNRISLFHDSFTTYLRKQTINYSGKLQKVNEIVYQSIMNSDRKFLSRFSSFDLPFENKKEIIIKFSSIQVFKKLMENIIDFEAIQDFYSQIREELKNLSADDLEIIDYYDLSLIINMISRDHISTLNSFLYTYIKVLLFNNYTEEDITSSKYLFAMLYYVKTNNSALLYNLTSNDFYDTRNFIEDLEHEIQKEDTYFTKHNTPLSEIQIYKILQYKTESETSQSITFVLENLYIFKLHNKIFPDLFECIDKYVNENEDKGLVILKGILHKYKVRNLYLNGILKNAKQNLFALGKTPNINDFYNLSLYDFILKNSKLGSFDLRDEIHNYIRLSLHQNRKIDISSISLFWLKYYNRKDYSLFNIDKALRVFEQFEFVKPINSCKLINSIQEISEKGYRSLLADYFVQHSPKIIEFVKNNFDIEDLRISWFDLPTEFINFFPDKIFQFALKEKLRYNHYNKEIDFKEIANIINSNRLEELKYVLNFTKYKVRISKFHKQKNKLLAENIEIIEFIPEEDKFTKPIKSEEHYEQGVLNSNDSDFILKNQMKCYEVAGFADGWYSVLADLDIFKIFDKNLIKENIKLILYNAILGKVKSINSFCSLSYLPGSIPKLVNDYKVETEQDKLFRSFLIYINLSLFDLKYNDKKIE